MSYYRCQIKNSLLLHLGEQWAALWVSLVQRRCTTLSLREIWPRSFSRVWVEDQNLPLSFLQNQMHKVLGCLHFQFIGRGRTPPEELEPVRSLVTVTHGIESLSCPENWSASLPWLEEGRLGLEFGNKKLSFQWGTSSIQSWILV